MAEIQRFRLADKSDCDEAARLVGAAAASGSLSILIGAGISGAWPSCLPMANDMVGAACDAIAGFVGTLPQSLRRMDGTPIRLEPFLRLVDVVCSTTDVEAFLNVLRVATPNANHFGLTNLVLNHPSCRIVDLNFDYLLEKALSDRSGQTSVRLCLPGGMKVLPHNSSEGRFSATVVKPHGTLLEAGGSEGIVATVQSLGQGVPDEMKGCLHDAWESRVVLASGYRDHDIDVFPLLRDTKPNGVLWNSLDDQLPFGVEEWLISLPSSAVVAHLIGPCELLFSRLAPSAPSRPEDLCQHDLRDFAWAWARGVGSRSRLAALAGWIAQDRWNVEEAKRLYEIALGEPECRLDIGFGRFVRYRYAELLRQHGKRKGEAAKQYLRVLALLFRRPLDLPALVATTRSLASTARSISHRMKLPYSIAPALLGLMGIGLAELATRLVRDPDWSHTRFRGEKNGIWLDWEKAMILLGMALQLPERSHFQLRLLDMALEAFKNAECSQDLYERASAVFGQARTLARIGGLGGGSEARVLAIQKLAEARDMFDIIDDVTGLRNTEELAHSIQDGDKDPWIRR